MNILLDLEKLALSGKSNIMSIKSTILGPKSKRNKKLPYTYKAKIDVLYGKGIEPVYDYYFADTICGLIEYLHQEDIKPEEVQIIGIYSKTEFELDKSPCVTPAGQWLKRPELCRSLEQHYEKTLEDCYKGHVDKGECFFEDRDRKGSGPY